MTVPRHAHSTRSPLHDWRVATAGLGGIAVGVRRRLTPFVGREPILQQLQQLLVQARGGERLVVALTGETGIGKSRLLREVAPRGAQLGLDPIWPEPPPARRPVADSGWERHQTDRVSAEPAARGVFTPPVASHGARGPLLVLIDASSPPDPLPDAVTVMAGHDGQLTAATFLALPAAAGSDGRALRRLLATLARCRVLVEVALPPLSDAELYELITHLLGGPPNARLHETISSLSEGNPFLAEELTFDLVQRGLVAGERDAWYLVGSLPASYIPDSVATVLDAELDALDPEVMQTLACAAVLGAGFRFDVLASALTVPADRLLLHLETGLAHGIVREAADPPDDFQFTHELTRRMLYRRLSSVRRRQLHQAVAEALERHPPLASDQSDRRAALAYHFTRGVDRQRALEHILRAQERAEHLQAWEDAIRYCREGLDLARQAADPEVELQLDLLERLGALYFGQVQTFATGACWREAFHLCEKSASPRLALRRAALAARLAALGPSWHPLEAAVAALEQALAAPHTSDADQAAWCFDALHELGLAHQRIGRLAEAARYLERAGDAADPTDWPRRALARVSLAGVLNTSGRSLEAAELAREALAILEAGAPEGLVHRHQLNHLRDPRRIRCRALGELARAVIGLDQLDEASRLVELVHEEEQKFGTLDGRAPRVAAQLELARGRPVQALRSLEARLRRSATGALSALRVADLLVLAQAQLLHGDAGLALATAAEGIRLCQRSGAREHLAGLYVATAAAHLARHALDASLEAATLALETIDQTGADAYRPGALQVLAACRAAMTAASDTPPPVPDVRAASRLLTAREREVLIFMAEGRTNRQIAEELVLSDKTVKRHLSNIFDKLGVSSRAAAVHSAFRAGLL